ncbi:MAG: hypothetical protein V6Z82_02430 [Flavobacteriales bacterium]
MRRLSLSLTILALIACSRNDGEMRATRASVGGNTLFQNLDASQIRHPIYLKGNFESWISKRDELVVFTETAQAKHLFVLQGAKKQSQTSIKDGIKSLLFLQHCFIVELANGNRLYFGVSKPEEKSIYNRMTRNDKVSFTGVGYGFGVIHRWIGKEDPSYADINTASLKDASSGSLGGTLVTSLSSPVDADCGSCDSGGAGATSCSSWSGSMGGCSISCGGGYYACCSSGFSNSCRCCPSGSASTVTDREKPSK